MSVNLLAEDIATYLVAQGIFTAKGTDIFVGDVPEDLSTGTMVLETGGPAPSVDIPTYDPTFQIWIRSVDYATGKALLQTVRRALHQNQTGTGNTYFGYPRFDNTYNFYYYYIQAIAEGGYIGKDDRGRSEFSINFHAKTR